MTVPMTVPSGGQELTAQWLTVALRTVSGGAVVTAVEATPIGTGNVAASIRLALQWDRAVPADLASVVAKVASADADSRAAAAMMSTYEVEAGWYSDLAADLPVRSPICHAAGFDASTGDYVVLLEDLSDARPGDQITGESVADITAAVVELAALHGPRWGDATLTDLPWIDRATPEWIAGTAGLGQLLLPGFLERYAELLGPGISAVIESVINRLPERMAYRPQPWTVVHGDYRVDNLLFGGPRAVVLDWQTVGLGDGLSDLAYLTGTSMSVADRRASESALIACYAEGLRSHGVEITDAECWDRYRLHSTGGLVMSVIASMLVARSERGDATFVAMACRSGQMAIDLDAEAALDHLMEQS